MRGVVQMGMMGDIHAVVERADLRDRRHVFRDRPHAGTVVAEMLAPRFEGRMKTLVVAIPAGGVPVAAAVAEHLSLPLDLAVVSKITLPWNSEVGYGAVAFDGSVLLNERLVRDAGLSDAQIEAGIARTRDKVVRRDAQFRLGRGYTALNEADAILVDDGLASGFTLRAAIGALRAVGAASVTVAVPTARASAARFIAGLCNALYCANLRSGPRFAVADAYEVWSDVDEAMVSGILAYLAPPPDLPR